VFSRGFNLDFLSTRQETGWSERLRYRPISMLSETLNLNSVNTTVMRDIVQSVDVVRSSLVNYLVSRSTSTGCKLQLEWLRDVTSC